MPEYEWQHYLPEVYLKQFSATKESKIWRFDEQESVPKSVRSQCAAFDFYSSTDRENTEKMFQQMEDAYGRILMKLRSGRPHTPKNNFGLILFMLQLHCRNVVYENLTTKENVDAYRIRFQCLRDLMGDANAPLSDQQFLDRWKVQLLKCDDPSGLVTSDNPSLFFTLDEIRLHLVMMPVTPSLCAVAYDSRFIVAIGDHLSVEDGSLLNAYQVKHCFKCLFTASELRLDQQVFIRQEWNERDNPIGCVDEQAWTPNLLLFPDGNRFRFLLKVETTGKSPSSESNLYGDK